MISKQKTKLFLISLFIFGLGFLSLEKAFACHNGFCNGPIVTGAYAQGHPFWGGGSNPNSLAGGGWGGFPLGYGMPNGYPVHPAEYHSFRYNAALHLYGPQNVNAPFGGAGVGLGFPGGQQVGFPLNNGPLLGGFGGFYSPFVGGK